MLNGSLEKGLGDFMPNDRSTRSTTRCALEISKILKKKYKKFVEYFLKCTP